MYRHPMAGSIRSVRWLNGNHILAFLGEGPGELPQVYTMDLRTRALTRRTNQTTEITAYDIAQSGDRVVYAAKPPADTSSYAGMRQHGFALRPTQFVGDVLRGAWYATVASFSTPSELFVSPARGSAPVQLHVPGSDYRSCDSKSVSVAPSGRVALIQCRRDRAPTLWTGYTEPFLAKLLAGGSTLPEFALLDLDHGMVEPLSGTPLLGGETVCWGPTSESVVIANVFLPLDITDSAERHTRVARPGIVELNVRNRHLKVIAYRDSLEVLTWAPATNTVEFALRKGRLAGSRVRYRKVAERWQEVRGGIVASPPFLVVEQGLNLPPRLVALDQPAKRRAVVLDPNPQIAQLGLGREEIARWRTQSGRERIGGLYYPRDFVHGHRYPLVIQTHGFDSTAFRPDGTFPTANAAQPMAAHGMLVLQIGGADDGTWVPDFMTLREAPSNMEEIEAAIDRLDSLGLVDHSRVGLIGFSRTCFYVLYTLTHSSYPIAAAAITDGVDFGYFQYMVYKSAWLGTGYTLDEYKGVNGGPPFGKNLDVWRDRAPGFNLDRIKAPLRLEAIGLETVLGEWEPYAGLLLQQKPVELFVIPDGEHILVKPWERLASSQGNVDWFRFWLLGEEDPDSVKAPQYARWRELRKLQAERTAGDRVRTGQPIN